MAVQLQVPDPPKLTIISRSVEPLVQAARDGRLIRDDRNGHYWKPREKVLYQHKNWDPAWQQRMLGWLRDNVHREIPRAYYNAVLGHDLHISMFGELFVQHFHVEQRDPFTGELGWLENKGRMSCGKVTTAFRDYNAGNFVSDLTSFGDFKFHRPGTGTTAEANTQTALVTDAGLEATGNQTNPTASTYSSLGTVTADTTETWTEHSIRNATGAAGGTMLDRSLTNGGADPASIPVVNLDTVAYTYVLTVNAEA